MVHETIKPELIEWLAKLDDDETIQYFKKIRDSKTSGHDWWDDLTDHQKQGIERGMRDIDTGRVTLHDDVKMKY